MAKFTIKCILLASLFFFGVLYGMERANEGIHDVKGPDHSPKVEQSADSTTHARASLDQKRETLQNIKDFNLFSSAGDVASGAVTGLFRTGVDTASDVIQKLLG